ncbi:hypothetical protein J6590_025948 [Homalodisca vitripennis]|nr:hypothetical protein J6590_025948 [Homalodisca vitripennis]
MLCCVPNRCGTDSSSSYLRDTPNSLIDTLVNMRSAASTLAYTLAYPEYNLSMTREKMEILIHLEICSSANTELLRV